MLINNSYFNEVARNGIPKFIPNSRDYREWWKEQIHRCKYGYSVGGKYMSGRLYFHTNFYTIERNYKNSTRKQKGFIDLRDIEWEIFSLIEQAKGYTGLDQDNKPIYDGKISGLMILGPRDFGKSVISSGNLAYEYTFFPDNEMIIGGYETKYISPTMAKLKVGLNNMPGDIEYMGRFHPSPLSHKRIKDQWDLEIRSGFKDNETGKTKGYNSRIYVRTFLDKATACNGLRASTAIFEEVGCWNNLLESYNNTMPCFMNSAVQFGSPILIGTGGDMTAGGSIDFRKMFYQPEVHNFLCFEDTYGGSGGKVGYFLPATKGFNQFKDIEGTSDEKAAFEEITKRREEKKKDKSSYEKELQYYPISPKEAFLITTGNIFPRALLEGQLDYLTATKAADHLGQKGTLDYDRSGELKWTPSDKLFECDYPHTQDSGDLEGCIVIYEHPQTDENGIIPFGLYCSGLDPVDQNSSTTQSLGSMFIYKKFWRQDRSYSIPVAEYTGRPENATDYYENARKILMYYNAKVLYENQLVGFKQYMGHKNCLHMLAEQPTNFIKDLAPQSKIERGYGIHMTKDIKNYMLGLIREWLMEEYEPGKFNVSKLYSKNLIKELLYYNDEINSDRTISFGLCLIYNQVTLKHQVEDNNEIEKQLTFSTFFDRHGLNKKTMY